MLYLREDDDHRHDPLENEVMDLTAYPVNKNGNRIIKERDSIVFKQVGALA